MGFFPPDATQGAVANRPTNKAPGAAGWFTDGGVGIPATVLDADFANGIVDEMTNLSVAANVPMSKSNNFLVQAVLNLISGIGLFVKKAGDTMSGPLNILQSYAAANSTPALSVTNTNVSLNVVPASTAAAYNPVVQNLDTVMYYTWGQPNTGGLVLAPYGTGTTGGLRLDNTGAATFSRPVYGPTAAPGTSNTQLATTAFVTQSQFQLPYTPVQQGGGVGQTADKVYLGSNGGSRVRLTVNTTDLGNVSTDPYVASVYAPLNGAVLTSATTGTIPPAGDASGALANTYWTNAYFAPISNAVLVNARTGTIPPFPDSSGQLVNTNYLSAHYQPKAYNASYSVQNSQGGSLPPGTNLDTTLTYAAPANGVVLLLGSTNVANPNAGLLNHIMLFNNVVQSGDLIMGSASFNNIVQINQGTTITFTYRVYCPTSGGNPSTFTAHASLLFIPSS